MESSATTDQLIGLLLSQRKPQNGIASLAEATGVPLQFLYDLLTGSIREPDSGTMLSLAEHLGISPEYFRCKTLSQAALFLILSNTHQSQQKQTSGLTV